MYDDKSYRVTHFHIATFVSHAYIFRISAPPGWQAYIHPEGRLYYCYESVVTFDGCSREIHVITQADLACDGVAETIEDLAKLAYSHAYHHSSFLVNVDLVLDMAVGETDRETAIGEYYFVHHENRCLFWLLDFDAVDILRECSGVTELAHKSQFCGPALDRV